MGTRRCCIWRRLLVPEKFDLENAESGRKKRKQHRADSQSCYGISYHNLSCTIHHWNRNVFFVQIHPSYLLHPHIDGLAERRASVSSGMFPAILGSLASRVELAIFRLVQECLANIHRILKAKLRLSVSLMRPTRFMRRCEHFISVTYS
jgi:hypothetical protein